MTTSISLAQYVKKRNGVPLGHTDSLKNMLTRSLGAGSFAQFWRYWNPVWGYYLSRFVMRPASRLLPIWLATIVTFLVSGALHDIAVSLIKWKVVFFITPWFGLMGMLVMLTEWLNVKYVTQSWLIRCIYNAFFVVSTWFIAYALNT